MNFDFCHVICGAGGLRGLAALGGVAGLGLHIDTLGRHRQAYILLHLVIAGAVVVLRGGDQQVVARGQEGGGYRTARTTLRLPNLEADRVALLHNC